MHQLSTGGTYCGWTAQAHALEGPVLREVRRVLQMVAQHDAPALSREYRRLTTSQPAEDVRVRRARLEREAARERKRLTDAAMLLVDGGIDRVGYDRICADRQPVLDALEAELARLTAPPITGRVLTLSQVGVLAEAWELLPETLTEVEEIRLARGLLAELVARVIPEKIAFARYHVAIEWTPTGQALVTFAS